MDKYGWFEFGYDPITITNYLSGQSLTVTQQKRGRTAHTYAAEYSDSEITANIRFTTSNNGIGVITLDYSNAFQEPPIYWEWRRIDDFVTDALLCWPDYFYKGGTLRLTVKGAWVSGSWRHDIVRQFSVRKSTNPESLAKKALSKPYVTPADIPKSQAWDLIDVDRPKTQSTLLFDIIEDANIPFLPSSRAIEGFQGHVPYLKRADGKAYLIFSELRPTSHRGEDPVTDLFYTYIDEDIFFTFRSHHYYKNELSPVINYGFRTLPPAREFWPVRPLGELEQWDVARSTDNPMSQFSRLSYPAWLRARHTLGDAWPAWGTPKRIEIENTQSIPASYGKVGYIGNYGPATKHGYCAGMVNSSYEVRYFNT